MLGLEPTGSASAWRLVPFNGSSDPDGPPTSGPGSSSLTTSDLKTIRRGVVLQRQVHLLYRIRAFVLLSRVLSRAGGDRRKGSDLESVCRGWWRRDELIRAPRVWLTHLLLANVA